MVSRDGRRVGRVPTIGGATMSIGARPAGAGLDRAWRVGFVVGAGLSVAARYFAKRAHRSGGGGLVDWPRAESIAVRRLNAARDSLSAAEIAAAQPAYDAAMRRIVPLLEGALGSPLPGVVERHEVVDRADWARANLVTFKQLVAKLEEHLLERDAARDASLGAGLAAMANRFLTTQQVAFLLGFLGSRVLGQYDIALLSAEAAPGRLLFVEENIRATASALDVPLDDFRIWIALHETTHAFEFEAHPWLRPYLASRLERQLASFLEDAKTLQVKGLGQLVKRWRQRDGGHLLSGFMTREQRQLLRETQVVMSLLEGFSDWVMDEVGSQVLPNVREVRERFEARRNQRRRGLDRLVARLTGLDMKLEQYRRGERFVAGVARAGGPAAMAHLWDGPETLPTEEEFAEPARWVRRVAPETLGGR
jgi:coenzyme F420 biosynthesis associated uncharacterized protein